MPQRIAIALALTVALPLAAGADLPRTSFLRQPARTAPEAFPPGESLPLFPSIMTSDPLGQEPSSVSVSQRTSTLQETSKLKLIRFVSGEFAKARKPLPGGKEGIVLYPDKPVSEDTLDRAVATHGAAVNTGDNAQITRLEFRERSIIVDVNGGGRPHKSWRDRIQFGMGGGGPISAPTTSAPQEQGPPGLQLGGGGTIYIQFPKAVPDLSPDELKSLLAPFLDFSKERSASVHWIDTLPPEKKKAITERHAILGMDRDEVIAAMGKPERKVRERDSNGNDTEDWIYGHPPDKTVFVRFTGDRVSVIKQYPQ